MGKLDNSKVVPRHSVIAIIMSFIAVAVIGKAIYTMTTGRTYWLEVATSQERDSVIVRPTGGNVLSCNGQLMASSLPEFKAYIGFNALGAAGNDTASIDSINYISEGLNNIFPKESAVYFKRYFMEGCRKKSKHRAIWNERIGYNTFEEIRSLPIFHLSKYRSGFHWDKFSARRHPSGSLIQRMTGDVSDTEDTACRGLELSYDSILYGTNSIIHRRKVRNRFPGITDTPPINGADIITTIDVSAQDLAERALLGELKDPNVNGNTGVVIVVEITIDGVKAIVNLDKCSDDECRKVKDHAVSDLFGPGPVSKTAFVMTILDDELVDTMYTVQTGPGAWNIYGRNMKDHNWTREGYGTLAPSRTLEYSSNIGVSRITDMHHHRNPERFVQSIYDLELATDFHVPIISYSPARICMPHRNSRGQYDNWGATALPRMSIGYETQIPSIPTLVFYNVIANDGKLMQSRFIKQTVKNGEVTYSNPPKVLKECTTKESTIKNITHILTEAVPEDLGKEAGSNKFLVTGETGTAQMLKGALDYKTGGTNRLLSFAGFSPADKPRYSYVVCIQKTGFPASGGGISGVALHHIAEGIMAQSLKPSVTDAHDVSSVTIPTVETGNLLAIDYTSNPLDFQITNGWNGAYSFGNPIRGITTIKGKSLTFQKEQTSEANIVPDVHGMGARDATYPMEKYSTKVVLTDRGRVIKQSVAPGEKVRKGTKCELRTE